MGGCLLGAATAYTESTLAQIYKENDRGQYRGGPAYYFEKFFGGGFGKFYGILVAISFIISCGLFLPGVQSNGVVKAITGITGEGTMVNTAFGAVGTNTLVVTLVMVLILGLIILVVLSVSLVWLNLLYL